MTSGGSNQKNIIKFILKYKYALIASLALAVYVCFFPSDHTKDVAAQKKEIKTMEDRINSKEKAYKAEAEAESKDERTQLTGNFQKSDSDKQELISTKAALQAQLDAKMQKEAEAKAAAEAEAAKKAAEAEAEAAKKAAAEEEQQAIATAKANMNKWEGYDINIAVPKIIKKTSTGQHTARGNGIFVYVDVAAYNNSSSTLHVNPNDFTLSTSTGYTVPHDGDTYLLSNYFDAVNLGPQQQTSGYLIFYITNDSKYTLNYYSDGRSVTKELIP